MENLSINAKKVLEKRYLKKDNNGQALETPKDLFRRVANNIAHADLIYNKSKDIKKTEEKFYNVMANLEFIPNSPTLMNAGRELQQLSACFVLPIEDSMESIFQTVKDAALIHKSGGGTGFSFSRLRPKNDVVQTTKGISSGPVSFMHVFDSATEAIKQGGTRRGANMGILRVDHPDILEFITCKADGKQFNNFNISVGATEEFMMAVEENRDYDLLNPRTKKPCGKLNAKKVFDMMVEMAWRNGDPGIIFLDRLNKDNPTPKVGEIESTNPCGEQPLLPYESCNLGSINLAKMVREKGEYCEMDWDKLGEVIHAAVHFLDNVIDMNKYPIKKIEENTKANRKIGLGVMGWADILIKLRTPYNSEEAISFAEKLMSFVLEEARDASHKLALERGEFANFKGSIYDKPKGLKLRNATLTTIAPTGTISMISNCSSGIEPLFAISYIKNVMDNTELLEVNDLFEKIAKEKGFYSEELMKKIAKHGNVADIAEVPDELKKIFVTAHEIEPKWHIRMQAAFQKHTNNAVSKTVNFANTATINDVEEVYMSAYKTGCKGVTIYRDRSRDEQVLNIDYVKKEAPAQARKILPRPRPAVTTGTTTKINTGCGNLYITINVDDSGLPFEIFTQMGKAGGCASSQLEAIARLVSLALRCGLEIKPLIDQLAGIRCPTPAWEKGGRVFSCADAIAKALERRLTEKVSAKTHASITTVKEEPKVLEKVLVGNVVGVCPDCGGALQYEEGCMICRGCGFSKCG